MLGIRFGGLSCVLYIFYVQNDLLLLSSHLIGVFPIPISAFLFVSI